jgi:hypothetical protein
MGPLIYKRKMRNRRGLDLQLPAKVGQFCGTELLICGVCANSRYSIL